MTSSRREGRLAEEEHACTALGFLISDHGFTGRVDREEHRTVLAYLRRDVFLEMELDWHEGAAFVLVGRPWAGERPDGYYVDSSGRRVRWHLVQVLAALAEPRLGGAVGEIRGVANLSGPEGMATQVATFARWLHEIVVDLDPLVRCIGD